MENINRLTLEEMKLLINSKQITIDTERDFKEELENIFHLAKTIREFSNHRYGDSVYHSGSVGNYYNLKRKIERLRQQFENGKKIFVEGDTLLDTYIDIFNYAIFGILIAILEEQIDPEIIRKKIKFLNLEI